MAAEQTVAQNDTAYNGTVSNTPVTTPQGLPFDFSDKSTSKFISDASGKSGNSSSVAKIDSAERQLEKDVATPTKNLKELMASPPTLEPTPKEPVEQNTDPWKTFGSPAMILATFGSLFTRAPLTAALNAGAGVMKAQADKDEAAYKKQMDLFKFHMEQYWKLADYKKDVRKAMFDENKEMFSEADTMFNDRVGAEIKAGQGQEAKDKHDEWIDKHEKMLDAWKPYVEGSKKAKEAGKPWDAEEEQRQFMRGAARMAAAEGKADPNAKLIANMPATVANMTKQYTNPDGSQMTPADVGGKITSQEAKEAESQNNSIVNIEHIADYVTQNPQSVGLLAEARKNLNLDAINALYNTKGDTPEVTQEAAQKALEDMDTAVDKAAQQNPNIYSPEIAGQAKVLNKMVIDQAFTAAGSYGGRLTVYMEKSMREMYPQNSDIRTFMKVLDFNQKQAADRLERDFNMSMDRNINKKKYPFYFSGSSEKYLAGKTGYSNGKIPNQKQIDLLKSDHSPDAIKEFDEHFGTGAAEKTLLGGKNG